MPLLLAYALNGGKLTYQFFPVFLCLVLLLVIFYGRFFWDEVPKVFLLVAVFLFWCQIRTLLDAPYFDGLYEFCKFFSYALFFILAYSSNDQRSFDYFINSIVFCGLLEATVLFVRYHGMVNMGGWLKGNPGYSAFLVGASLLFVVAHFFSIGNLSKERLVSLGAIVYLSIGLLLTQSRSALAGVLVGIFFIFPKGMRFRLFLMMSVGLLFLILNDQFFLKIDPGNTNFSYGRVLIWKTGLMAVLAKWFAGFGLGNFESAYALFALPSGPILNYDNTTGFAHNGLLQIAVETGLVGLSLFILGIWTIIKSIDFQDSTMWSKKGSLAVLLMTLVFSMFSFSFYLPLIGLLVSGCCAFLINGSKKNTDRDFKLPIGLKILGFTEVGLCCAFLFFAMLSGSMMASGRFELASRLMPIDSNAWYQRALSQSNPASRIADLKKALRWNPRDPFIWENLGRTLGFDHESSKNEIRACYDHAEQLSPNHAPFWIDNGIILLHEKDILGAKEKLKKAIHLEPQSSLPYYVLGLALIRENKIKSASKMIMKAIEMQTKNSHSVSISPYSDYLYSVNLNQAQSLLEKLKSNPVL